MPEQLMADRAKLRQLLIEHPAWSHRQLARATNHSIAWVRKWKKRLAKAPNDETVLWGLLLKRLKNHCIPLSSSGLSPSGKIHR